MQKYVTFFGTINSNRQVYVFTTQGKTEGSCESLEKWLEDNDYTLVSLLQPDPVRVPHKVNIVVFKPNPIDINYADIETRVLYYGMDMADEHGDVTLAALLKKKEPSRGTKHKERESSDDCETPPTGRMFFPFGKRRTKPSAAAELNERLYRLCVTKDGFAKFETKPYTTLTINRLRAELTERFPDCTIYCTSVK